MREDETPLDTYRVEDATRSYTVFYRVDGRIQEVVGTGSLPYALEIASLWRSFAPVEGTEIVLEGDGAVVEQWEYKSGYWVDGEPTREYRITSA